MKLLIWIYFFIAFCQCDIIGERKSVCDLTGMCEGSILDELYNIKHKQECLTACKNDPNCNWFTYLGNSETCLFFVDCLTLDESCNSCTSGNSKCKNYYSKLLIGNGLGEIGEYGFVNTFEVIDLKSPSSRCDEIQPFPIYIDVAVGGLDFDERPIICGGYDINGHFRGDCHSFNGTDWTVSHPLTESRIIAASLQISPFQEKSEKLLLSGGFNGQVRSSLEVLTRDGWKRVSPDMPAPAYSHCMAVINETSVIAIGGYSNGTACSPDTFILNTETGMWTDGPKLKTRRVDHSCGSIRTSQASEGFSVVVVGGNCGSWISSVEVLDLESNEWIAGPELPFGIGAGGLVEDYQGGIVLTGGCSDEAEALDTIFHLQDLEASWYQIPKTLKIGRHAHTSILVPDDFVACH